MRILLVIIMLLPYVAVNAQDYFYEMVSAAIDSCCEAVESKQEKVVVEPSYFPFEYRYISNIQLEHFIKKPIKKNYNNPKYKQNTIYVSGYNAILRKDTIIVTTLGKSYRSGSNSQCRLFRRIDKIRPSSIAACSRLLYVYNDDDERRWKRKSICKELEEKIADENWLRSGVDLQDCIDFALNESINSQIDRLSNYCVDIFENSIDKFLVLDNTFGDDFFYNKYSYVRAFPYLVASEYQMKNKDLKKYPHIFGWCEIYLNDKTLIIVLRQVDGRVYGIANGKYGLERATNCKYIYEFAYSDVKKMWACYKSVKIDYLSHSLTWKEY